ncbi:MAG: Crp/Fnr family transcriptional regulator [Candidatus Kapabacteria bacterium]|jgi:CRP-like cAMP-binding protein|nr:Crp/Fnr family transcriptional regulator [Candidatus Kapabacteria bacterium]
MLNEHTLFLKNFISYFVQPTEQQWNVFFSYIHEENIEKGKAFVTKEIPCTKLYFIVDGIARHYLLDQNNDEITTWFNLPGSLATDFAGFTINEPQPFVIQAITPITALSISNIALEQLYQADHIWERLGRLINQYYLIELIKRNNGMLKKNARERYEEFCTQYIALFNSVPLKYIASYLNITLETLSRLRSNTY